jgi:uncharacterized membrane protein YdjX (TVP38/TMEM64 family)
MAGTDLVERLLARARSRSVLPLLVAAGLILVAVIMLGHEIGRHVQTLESRVAGLGPWGMLVFVVLLALGTSLLLPESLFGVAAGALFGLTWGVVVSLAGNLLAATIQYSLSHRLLRRRIHSTLARQQSLAAIQRAVMREELRLQLLLRLTPLNPATISYLLGAAGVRFSRFFLACLALTPHLFIEVYLGHAGKRAAQMAGVGVRSGELHDLAIFGGLAVGIVVIALVSRIAHKAVVKAVAHTEDVDTGDGVP